jgi:hypothetical protein
VGEVTEDHRKRRNEAGSRKMLLGSVGREREAFLQLWSLSWREVQIKHKTLQTRSLTGDSGSYQTRP